MFHKNQGTIVSKHHDNLESVSENVEAKYHNK